MTTGKTPFFHDTENLVSSEMAHTPITAKRLLETVLADNQRKHLGFQSPRLTSLLPSSTEQCVITQGTMTLAPPVLTLRVVPENMPAIFPMALRRCSFLLPGSYFQSSNALLSNARHQRPSDVSLCISSQNYTTAEPVKRLVSEPDQMLHPPYRHPVQSASPLS